MRKVKEKINRIINTRQFHICMVVFIMFLILFVVGLLSLKYNVEGEVNLPFYLSKIAVISGVEGDNVEDANNKWNLSVNQNNDIYLYIKKNDQYKETEIIKSIELNNFNIKENSKIGELKLLRPDNIMENVIFSNSTDSEVDKIEYLGDMDSNIKNLKISNQGGLVVFRYAVKNIGNYISNEDEEINHSELLKKLSINNDDLKFKVTFDILINLNSDKTYKANMELELPIDNVVDNGIQSKEFTDLKNIVFKRM